MLRAIFQKDRMLLDRSIGHGRILVFYSLGLALGATPWLVEAASLAGAAERRPFFERFLALQWVLAALLVPWVMAKLMAREGGGRDAGWLAWTGVPPARFLLPKLALLSLVALELAITAAPLVALHYELGTATLRECWISQAELLAFTWMLAPLAALWQLALDRPLAALGATYVTLLALVRLVPPPISGSSSGAVLWLGAAVAGAGLVALRSHRRFLHADD